MKPLVRTIHGQPSWVISSGQVSLAVTQLGGHMAPVTFCRDTAAPIQPYHITHWQGTGQWIDEPVLRPLRGDFFCLPFGNGGSFGGGTYASHGDPACSKWRLVNVERGGGVTGLHLEIASRFPRGRVTKSLWLADGQNVVYSRNVLAGFDAKVCFGHHATLAMPARQESVLVSVAPFRFGLTNPTTPGNPATGSYYSLAVGKRFADLARVPSKWKEPAYVDCSRQPTRKGYCDLYAVYNKPSAQPAWVCASFTDEGFLWFALKDPRVLTSTMFWAENHGRHQQPWDGRNCCLGIEDVTACLAEGLEASVKPNLATRLGAKTSVRLTPSEPLAVNYIQGVVKTPRGFGKVEAVEFVPGQVVFTSAGGKKVRTAVDHEFLASGRLKAEG